MGNAECERGNKGDGSLFPLGFSCALLLLLCGSASLHGEEPEDPLSVVVRSLLAEPIPAQDWKEHLGMALHPSPEDLVAGREPVPPDDAPLEFLVAFWSGKDWFDRKDHFPSDKVRARLLEACRETPRFLPSLLFWLPDTPEAHATVKKAHDAAAEWESFLAFLGGYRVDDLPPLDSQAFTTGPRYEYLHLTRRGGVRVFMIHPGAFSGTLGTIYDRLVERFRCLADPDRER
jgi:hypothetical protein